MEPTVTSEAVSSTLPSPACTNVAIEPTATPLSSTLSTLIQGTEPTPSLILNTSTSSPLTVTSLTNSASSTDCVCNTENTLFEEISTVVTSMSVIKTAPSGTPGRADL